MCGKACFNNAKKENGIESYEKYLKEYPSGIYKREAMDRIEDITWEDIRKKNQTPTKPAVDPSAKESCYMGGPRGNYKNCFRPTSDGGKLCTSSNECQGNCWQSDFHYIHGGKGREGRRIGKCSDSTVVPSGCLDFIENGRTNSICSD